MTPIAIISQTGEHDDAGVHLAATAHDAGGIALAIDTDPQATASQAQSGVRPRLRK